MKPILDIETILKILPAWDTPAKNQSRNVQYGRNDCALNQTHLSASNQKDFRHTCTCCHTHVNTDTHIQANNSDR